MNNYFKEQMAEGATDKFFYGVYGVIPGTLSIKCHKGSLETLSLDGLVFDQMLGSTPMFKPVVN